MKNIILLISFILLTISIFAQSFKILDESKQDITNGAVTLSDNVDSLMKGQIYIVNNTLIATPFKVKKIETNVLSNSVNTFCFGGQCYPPYVMETPTSMMLQPGDTTEPNDYYADYTGSAAGSSIITYVVYNANNVNDSVYVTITYNTTPAGISKVDFSKVDFSNPYPNPVSSLTRMNYNIPANFSKATLILRNLIGTSVKEFVIEDPQGKLVMDLSDLKEGIYFYSLIIDDNVILTRKLIKN